MVGGARRVEVHDVGTQAHIQGGAESVGVIGIGVTPEVLQAGPVVVDTSQPVVIQVGPEVFCIGTSHLQEPGIAHAGIVQVDAVVVQRGHAVILVEVPPGSVAATIDQLEVLDPHAVVVVNLHHKDTVVVVVVMVMVVIVVGPVISEADARVGVGGVGGGVGVLGGHLGFHVHQPGSTRVWVEAHPVPVEAHDGMQDGVGRVRELPAARGSLLVRTRGTLQSEALGAAGMVGVPHHGRVHHENVAGG